MSVFRDRVAWLAAPLVGGYLGVVTLDGFQTAATRIAPGIETLVSPIVAFDPVTRVTRAKDKVCFDLDMTKLHAAVPIKYTFFVEARLSDRIPVAAYLADRQNRRLKNADLTTHSVGEHWTRHYCFDPPRTVQDLDIRVSGTALHRRHPFYDTPTPIPPFNVPAPTT